MTTTASKVSVVAIAAAIAMLAFASVASADDHRRGGDRGDDVSVRNHNGATVNNTASVKANTGKNDALGGDSGRGGNGGNARGQRATGGHGGNSGKGGEGGYIGTGVARAVGSIYNDVNTNMTDVEPCGCEDDFFPFPPQIRGPFMFGSDDDVSVSNRNRANVTNNLTVKANTGKNDSDGGYSGRGGDGGNAANNAFRRLARLLRGGWATGGNGGTSGGGGHAGDIVTGNAHADGLISSAINTNITRVGDFDEDEDEDEDEGDED